MRSRQVGCLMQYKIAAGVLFVLLVVAMAAALVLGANRQARTATELEYQRAEIVQLAATTQAAIDGWESYLHANLLTPDRLTDIAETATSIQDQLREDARLGGTSLCVEGDFYTHWISPGGLDDQNGVGTTWAGTQYLCARDWSWSPVYVYPRDQFIQDGGVVQPVPQVVSKGTSLLD